MAYVLFPGKIVSKIDHDLHYVSAVQLARLYGIDFSQCKVVYADRNGSVKGYRKQPGDVELRPREDGDYRLPAKQ